MKRLALSLLSCGLLLSGAALVGCGDQTEPTNPSEVIDRAFEDVAAEPETSADRGAQIEVTSLGYEDAPLKSRKLSVDPGTYAVIREAIAGPAKGTDGGLRSLFSDLESEGIEDLDGTEVDHVSGTLDITKLTNQLSDSIEAGSVGSETELPGLGDLAQLEETLTGATFDLYAEIGEGSFERLDLTLSLDDQDNALPATRIRFSLTEPDPEKAPS